MFEVKKRRVLYLLFGYVILQFLWWEILLVKIHHQNIEKEKQLRALNITDSKKFDEIVSQLNKEQKLKIIMIVGEGTVFLVLIIFGFYRLLKMYEREILVSERQTHFLLSLPHEIKTPLSVMQLNLQTILNKNIEDEQKKNLIKKSLDELKRLQTLIEQIFLTNKISKDKYQLQLKNIDFSRELEEWIKVYSEQKNIECKIQENIFIHADEQLVQLLVQNLLSNAIKFSDEIIKVELYQKNNRVYLEISNDGELIKDDEKEKIFELFYRRKSDDERGIKGTGLGLYLVKQIAHLHHFKINAYIKNHLNVFQVVF